MAKRAGGELKAKAQAPGKTGAWRVVNRIQLAELMDCSPDTVTDWSREGMPVLERGGRGKESRYDMVVCLAWRRDREGVGKSAKDRAQTDLYRNNAELAALKIAREQEELLPRDEVEEKGKHFAKGLQAQIRSLPRRARHAGVIATQAQEVGLATLCRQVLTEIASWNSVAAIKRATKKADAA